MSLSTLNNNPINDGTLSIPALGSWVMGCTVSTQDANAPFIGQTATIMVDGHQFSGTVTDVDVSIVGFARVRAIGGNGGLASPIAQQSWTGPQCSVVLDAILQENGESPASRTLSDPNVLSSVLGSWTTFSELTLAQNITRLVQACGATWRMDPESGTLYVLKDTYADQASLPSQATVNDVNLGRVTWEAPNGMDNLPLPGQTNSLVGDINEVVVHIHADQVQFTLRNQALASIVSRAHPQELYGTYDAIISSQNPDNTVNITFTDARIAGVNLQNVRIKGGASATWQVGANTPCSVAFMNGRIDKAYVVGIDGWYAGSNLVALSYGDPTLAQFLAKSDVVDSNFNSVITDLVTLVTALQNMVNVMLPVAFSDGGTLQGTFLTAAKQFLLKFPTDAKPTACSKVKST